MSDGLFIVIYILFIVCIVLVPFLVKILVICFYDSILVSFFVQIESQKKRVKSPKW